MYILKMDLRTGEVVFDRCVLKTRLFQAKPELGVHCHVSLLDKYVSKLPPKAHEIDCFYMKPLSSQSVAADPSKPWFASQPCGANIWSKTCLQWLD